MKRSILIVDDETDMLRILKRSIEPDLDAEITTAASGEEAIKRFAERPFDLVLADIRMPGMNGVELLEMIKRDYPGQTVVMMTAFGGVETAVEAMKQGAYDFITKPFDYDALRVRLEKALERAELMRENQRLQLECRSTHGFQDLVGKSQAMQRVYETIQMVAKTDLTVLITGESGTGKELTARAIHALSGRQKRAFIAVNCPTVPEQILESELFGYKKGAFTHATGNRIGLFQEADKGSIFLDEIGDVSLAIQTKLLRVLQEKEIKPLGDTKSVKVDVRIIASTNQDLKKKIHQGQFREDFFYRLNVLPIRMPPLRNRVEDLPLICSHLLEKHCAKLDRSLKKISPALMELFMKRPWEGNIRELENLIMRGVLFSTGAEIQPSDVGIRPQEASDAGSLPETFESLAYKAAKERVLQRFNDDYIGYYLRQSGGNVTHAAGACGLERQALQQIMRRYGIKADAFRED